MKKLFIASVILLGTIFLNQQTEAAQCSGGGEVYVCGHLDFQAYAESAFKNCCAGSIIHTVDICGGDVEVTIRVNFSGANSSC